jgi:hypothetical protein
MAKQLIAWLLTQERGQKFIHVSPKPIFLGQRTMVICSNSGHFSLPRDISLFAPFKRHANKLMSN